MERAAVLLLCASVLQARTKEAEGGRVLQTVRVAPAAATSNSNNNALGLTDQEVRLVTEARDLYENSISYKHNLHEIMKPFLSDILKGSGKSAAEEKLEEIVLAPINFLGNESEFMDWIRTAVPSKYFRKGAERKMVTEILELLEMALGSKLTPEMREAVKKLIKSAYSLNEEN